jgi:hypothetical protein
VADILPLPGGGGVFSNIYTLGKRKKEKRKKEKVKV